MIRVSMHNLCMWRSKILAISLNFETNNWKLDPVLLHCVIYLLTSISFRENFELSVFVNFETQSKYFSFKVNLVKIIRSRKHRPLKNSLNLMYFVTVNKQGKH